MESGHINQNRYYCGLINLCLLYFVGSGLWSRGVCLFEQHAQQTLVLHCC